MGREVECPPFAGVPLGRHLRLVTKEVPPDEAHGGLHESKQTIVDSLECRHKTHLGDDSLDVVTSDCPCDRCPVSIEHNVQLVDVGGREFRIC